MDKQQNSPKSVPREPNPHRSLSTTVRTVGSAVALGSLIVTAWQLFESRNLREVQTVLSVLEQLRLERPVSATINGQGSQKLMCNDTVEGVATGNARAAMELAARRGVSLQRINAPCAYLQRAQLVGLDLSGSQLFRADFTDADLSNVELSNAKLKDALLVRARLDGANLMGTDLTGARLTGAVLTEVQNLTVNQLNKACGDVESVHLPSTLSNTELSLDPCPEIRNREGQGLEFSQGETESQTRLWNGKLSSGDSHPIEVKLEQNQDYTFLGTCNGCDDLDLTLADSAGSIVANDWLLDNIPVLSEIQVNGGTFVIEVIMVSCGTGECTWELEMTNGIQQ